MPSIDTSILAASVAAVSLSAFLLLPPHEPRAKMKMLKAIKEVNFFRFIFSKFKLTREIFLFI
jgi:hypothetical protein